MLPPQSRKLCKLQLERKNRQVVRHGRRLSLTREQDERDAQRKAEQKREIERKRAAKQEEERRAEEERKVEEQRNAAEQQRIAEARRTAQKQAGEQRRLELARKAEQQRGQGAIAKAKQPGDLVSTGPYWLEYKLTKGANCPTC